MIQIYTNMLLCDFSLTNDKYIVLLCFHSNSEIIVVYFIILHSTNHVYNI